MSNFNFRCILSTTFIVFTLISPNFVQTKDIKSSAPTFNDYNKSTTISGSISTAHNVTNQLIESDIVELRQFNGTKTIVDDAAKIPKTKAEFTVKTIKSGRNNDSVMRAALRLAARQGLEAMIDLYDKKEPNLLKKGKF